MTQEKTNRVIFITILLFTIVFTVAKNIQWDHETISTLHWFSDDALYYGGGIQSAFITPKGFVPIAIEKTDLLHNAHVLLYSLRDRVSPVGAYISLHTADRYFSSSYLASLVIRASFGYLDVREAYAIVNIALWLSSILAIYKTAKLYFIDKNSGIISAIILGAWPLYTLMFHSMKIQYGAIVYLLIGIYLYERFVFRLNPGRQALFALPFWFIGSNCSGGSAYLFVYLVLRAVLRWRETRWSCFWAVMAMAPLAVLLQGQLLTYYKLRSLLQTFSYGTVIVESLATLKAALMGESLDGRKFLSFNGFSYFSRVIPLTAVSLWHGNAAVVLLGVPGLLLYRRWRWLALLAALLLIVGFLPITFVGNAFLYAGFGAPAMLFLILGSGALLGRASALAPPFGTLAALTGLMAALWLFMSSYVDALDYYYGDLSYLNKSRHVFVYHGETLDSF